MNMDGVIKMNREQKIATATLVTSLLGMSVLITAVLLRRFIESVPKIVIILPSAVLAVAFLVLIGRFKHDKGAVKFDERDRQIQKNASLAGFAAVFLLVILVSYMPFAVAPDAKIPTEWFAGLLPVAALCYGFATSLSTLIQYGRGLPPRLSSRDEAAGGKQNE
jgi:hypothetical protein